jgi:DNA-directed RNA polymerase II subunit RPB1
MNLIFPRSSRTRNEIWELANPGQFFISYQSGNPALGQSHDSVIGLAELTSNGTSMDKFHAMKMFSQTKVRHNFSQYGRERNFTGREIVSIFLRESGNHVNLVAKPSSYQEMHSKFRRYDPTDIKVEIDRGEIKSGVLDKSTIGGDSPGGLYHIIHNQYGPEAALEACFYMQQMANSYLFCRGFTIHMGDLVLKDSALAKIREIERGLIKNSMQITEQLNQGKIISPIGKTLNEYYEELQINALRHDDEIWRFILGSIDPENNNLYKSIITGTKGKLFNMKNTVCALGQVEINGERMRENFGRRSLPYFTKDDSDPMSRGYVPDSYITGLSLPSMLFHSMESRYALINRALSTAVTGHYNRMAVKNLEAIIIDNRRRAMNGERVTQILYGADGADPRFVENVRVPIAAADLTTETFERDFHTRAAGKQKSLQEALDAEFEQLQRDREFYIRLFLTLETSSGQPYTDRVSSPINPHRIIEDTLYNLGLKSDDSVERNLDLAEAVAKIRQLCDEIPYCLLNQIQRERRAPIPEYLRENCTMICIVIRSYLNTATLLKRGVTDEVLSIVIKKIELAYHQSLISYGKNIGIITSQCISEPMTQMVLNSHHFAGAGGVKRRGLFRIKEVLTATPTYKMRAPTMTLQVLPRFRNNKIKVQEIANHIEMLPLRQFVSGWQVFFEKFGEPEHPNFITESKFIRNFAKYHIHNAPPGDLTRWCIRLALDKIKLIEKQMKIETIYHRVRQEFPFTYVVYSSDNAENNIMRIYLRNSFSKKGVITTQQVAELVEELQNLGVRGVDGVKAAYVVEGGNHVVQANGSVKKEPAYYIATSGTNLERILENPYIDPDTVQSDSIAEMYQLFGIGAARNKIISELKGQISGSSHRHYTIYADEMTSSGVVTSIDRYGSAKRSASVLLRISDASPIAVIEESAVNSFSDDLTGVSPSIMVGKNPRVGDLYNRFKLDEEMTAKNSSNIDSAVSAI